MMNCISLGNKEYFIVIVIVIVIELCHEEDWSLQLYL